MSTFATLSERYPAILATRGPTGVARRQPATLAATFVAQSEPLAMRR
jgi:hypothetical protein